MGCYPMETENFERWLERKEAQLRTAKHLFNGGKASAVMLDPVGLKFPRSFYSHLLRYEPGVGLVPDSINPAYMGRIS